MPFALIDSVENAFARAVMHSRLPLVKSRFLKFEDKSMPSIACYRENPEEADAVVDAGTRRALTLFDGLQQCFNELSGHIQINAAQLEVSARAWKASAAELPAHWLEADEFNAPAQAKAFDRLDKIIDWMLTRPDILTGHGSKKPFATAFLAEREKLKSDDN
jgi:hypothetical protein